MASLSDLGRRMEIHAANIERNAPLAQRVTAVAVLQVVTLSTPVDTGRARTNWLVGIGGAKNEVVESAGTDGGIAGKVAKLKNTQTKQGQDIHITNNLPYIVRLNEGHSAQAPAGFVEQAIAAAVEAIKSFRLLAPNRGA